MSSSNCRACRSTRSSASAVARSRFSMTKLPRGRSTSGPARRPSRRCPARPAAVGSTRSKITRAHSRPGMEARAGLAICHRVQECCPDSRARPSSFDTVSAACPRPRQGRAPIEGLRRQHPPPVSRGRIPVELLQQADHVHLERRRVDDPLEPVGRNLVGAAHSPRVGVGAARPRIVDTTWRNMGRGRLPDPSGRGPSRPGGSGRPRSRRDAEVVIQMSMPNLLMSGVQSSSSR